MACESEKAVYDTAKAHKTASQAARDAALEEANDALNQLSIAQAAYEQAAADEQAAYSAWQMCLMSGGGGP